MSAALALHPATESDPGERSRWGVSVLSAALIEGGLLLALAWVALHQNQPPPPPPPIAIQLVAPQPVPAPPQPQVKTPPPPPKPVPVPRVRQVHVPQHRSEVAHVVHRQPPPPPKSQVVPHPAPLKPVVSPPHPAPVARVAPRPAPVVPTVIRMSDLPPSFIGAVRTAVQGAAQYPAAAAIETAAGTAHVEFLFRDGKVSAAHVVQSTGNSFLDEAAVQAVLRAHYPPTPKDFAGKMLDFTVDVIFTASQSNLDE